MLIKGGVMFNKLSKALIGAVVLLFMTSFAFAQADPVYNFYNGLANIIEENMNSPDACVAKAVRFINDNLKPLQDAMQRGVQMAQTQQYDQMSQEEIVKKAEEGMQVLSQNKSMEAVMRFSKSMQEFAMNYPEHTAKISEAMSVSEQKGSGY